MEFFISCGTLGKSISTPIVMTKLDVKLDDWHTQFSNSSSSAEAPCMCIVLLYYDNNALLCTYLATMSQYINLMQIIPTLR